MLQVSNVVAGYGRGVVLHDLSLSVEEGEILGVLGRNGMGKSTLIRVLAGLLKIRSGHLRVGDTDLTKASAHVRTRHGIAVVPQGRGVFSDLTVTENLKLGRLAAGGRVRAGRLQEVLEYFPRLAERPKQRAGTMSGGEQQMLAIARAMMTEPRILLLDEPSDGIMPMLVQQIADDIKEINRNEGLTTVVVEQNVPMVTRMSTRCLILESGRIVANGPVRELMASGEVEQHLGV
ncbi:ABC transporter ATP-binding protein [Nocardioides panacis]|uniref:ABC transporter ATP-binding protein n=1 Tax=Nocardioides panacis TaxID=2849501 RepID=A0A975T3D0_9ACTN|nr:ABC transporter ATP-binding protein [Nocardioides panacis]QWZ10134.1 ABC transporter ATP-binding protein [Nocardioides panacis]